MTKVRQLQYEDLTKKNLISLAWLFSKIKGRSCPPKNFIEYVLTYFETIAIFAGFNDDGDMVAFTVASEPSIIDPESGYLPFSVCLPSAGIKTSRDGLRQATEWLKNKGAKVIKMETVLDPYAMSRLHGFKLGEERLMVKVIT